MTRVAVVRVRGLTLFGKYTNAIEKLRKLCEVDEVYVESSVNQDQLAEMLQGYEVVISEPMAPVFGEEFFEANSSVKLIVINGRGYDNVDVESAVKHGVLVARVPGYCEAQSVAEHTLALLLYLLRNVKRAENFVRNGLWSREGYVLGDFMAPSLDDLVYGFIGFGWIGSRVASILSRGFNARSILVYDPYVPRRVVEEHGWVWVERLEDLLSRADVLLIHAELNDQTYHLLGERELGLVKEGVVIVNTARGAIIDTNALVKYLEKGKIRGVALDVVEGEPIPGDHPLLRFENVVVTPHIAYATRKAVECMDLTIVKAVECYLGKHCEIEELVVKKKPWYCYSENWSQFSESATC